MKVDSRTPFPDTFVRDNLKTGNMKTIQLTQGKVTMVDDEDYDYLMQWKWHAANARGVTHYAARTINKSKSNTGKHVYIPMHRQIMNAPKNIIIDHIDHNGLNNQKSNLRECTCSQNSRYKIKAKNKRSEYKGVSFNRFIKGNKEYQYICAHIRIDNRKLKFLGSFKTEEAAARAYDEAAKLYFGEFAYLNFR